MVSTSKQFSTFGFIFVLLASTSNALPGVGLDVNGDQATIRCPVGSEAFTVPCCQKVSGKITSGSGCAFQITTVIEDVPGITEFTNCCAGGKAPEESKPEEPVPEKPHNCKDDEHPQDCSDNPA